MDEFSFIRSIQPAAYFQSSLIKGVSDDAAVFRQPSEDVVTAVDTMVEDVHFSKETMDPYHVGYRALAANLSDLAAMGSKPAFYLVSLVVSKDWSEEELKELYRGMQSLAKEHQIDLIGGDTVSGKQLCVSITVFGYVLKNKARYRNAARHGDVVFATGTLGDSRAGLECILKGRHDRYLIDRHRLPSPRVRFAEELAFCRRVALNDISDGIASEANEIAEASQVDLHLNFEQLPFSPQLAEFFPSQYEEWVLTGGEDFELIGTVNEQEWPRVLEAAEKTGTSVAQIGRVKDSGNTGAVYLYKEDVRTLLTKSGYTHLQEERD
ncbi:thiamine-phosphate kinase [Halobacillus sp. A5]|uniref:thiamine-phosphate kinase n=1 Tax=Halobacillus sp. A5 TaxID=2880263 RepID=UPI0020A68C2D|nr:thiamine-phosphate kinase [Halobacillus sp. A5]MCP3028830.1 thiamine-phosphate kinase [Halobacillus sp. A5]